MTPSSTLQDVLPAAMNQAIRAEMTKGFQSTMKLPKRMNRHLVARAVDKALLEKVPEGSDSERPKTISEIQREMGLLASEVEYVSNVLAEFRAWDAAVKTLKVEPNDRNADGTQTLAVDESTKGSP